MKDETEENMYTMTHYDTEENIDSKWHIMIHNNTFIEHDKLWYRTKHV